MSPAILINLLFPIATALLLWVMKPAEGSLVSYDFMLWFWIGAGIQILAALVLMGRNQGRWVLGWTLLWLASAGFMAAYAPAHVHDAALQGKWNHLTAPKPEFPAEMEVSDQDQKDLVKRQADWQKDKNAADLWFREQYKIGAADESYLPLAKRDLAKASYLLYVLAFAFLSAFFSISWFAGRGRLHEYHVSGGSEEEPLAKNDMGRGQAEA